MDQTEAPVHPDPDLTARKRRPGRFGFWCLVTTIVVLFGLAFGVMTLSGKTLRLPVWAVAELEARLNAAVIPAARLAPGSALSVGAVDITVDRDLVPRFRLEDLRLLRPGGAALIILPELRVSLDPAALLKGQIRPASLRISGARLTARRGADGQFDFAIGTSSEGTRFAGFAAVLDAVDATFDSAGLASLRLIEAEALTLSLNDARAGRTWEVGDGRLVIENQPGAVRAELSLSLLGAATPAQAVVTVTADKTDSSARIAATVDSVAAADIAAFAPPLAWLAVVDAPISGQIETSLAATGTLAALQGKLTLGAGALQPSPEAKPIAFDRASMALSYDPGLARITLQRLALDSPSMRLTATGHSYLLDGQGQPIGAGATPETVLGQLSMSEVMVDPAGLFVEPVRFGQGAMDWRLRLNPFRIDLGQLSLTEGAERLLLKGTVSADPKGWQAALDVALNRITTGRLMTLWPLAAVPRTRAWLVANVQEGALSNVRAALRIAPGTEPRFTLGYEFADTDVRFLKTLPPIQDGFGHATMEGTAYTLVLDKGRVTPPLGGDIDMAGSVFRVPDITQKPARGAITLRTDSSLTAALSLLDQPPFRFLTKAGQPVDLGTGRARLVAELGLPLVGKVGIAEIDYTATGTVTDMASSVIVPGRTIAVPELTVRLDKQGLALSGQGTLGKVPFDVTYAQSFAPDQKGKARVEGSVSLSDTALRDFGIELPEGSVAGTGQGQITIDLVKGQPARLALLSDLNRMTLRLDALGWGKAAGTLGRLEAEATLGAQPEVSKLSLKAPGLVLAGSVTTRADGGLDVAQFGTVQAGDWMDASVTLTGRGKGKPVDIALTGGSIDLRKRPEGGSSAADGSPFTLQLDEVIVSQSIRLTRFRGEFSPRGGLNGTFTALVNGAGPVRGTVVPVRAGSAVRLLSEDAGAVMSAAGVMSNGRGGAMDLQLSPRGGGTYAGRATFSDLRVRDAPVLAELLSAVSVVGLLEQFNGEGLLFSDGEVDFVLTPDAVQITQGSAVGLSLGISMAGLYRSGPGLIDLQGVVSPIYLVNGIGALFSRRGEGVFGFNYRMTGPVADPDVSVNPLSIFTPGMFREIFRRAPPTLKNSG
ncbi:MAG: DUF3971 domain-containing protein [Pseudomonadota bacterium]